MKKNYNAVIANWGSIEIYLNMPAFGSSKKGGGGGWQENLAS